MGDRVQTPSQTVGPFFHFGLEYDGSAQVVPGHYPGAIRLHGTVFDGGQAPVPDALLEIWQTDAAGLVSRERGSLLRNEFAFTGFGRAATNLGGEYAFTTVRPGTGFVTVAVFARGLSHHLFTRAYFDDGTGGGASDSLLASLPPSRRSTLLAMPDGDRSFRFDVRLQGDGETVFLEYS
ncbi:protocatechuate 3,4-dioxygenase alpha subunit [Glaciihabitans tibetensis]|uniref:Protocatechuate 3,4-dioxygenase alpha subunit n=1 Tax=Glaciihabitans tibetensis TaxID=1266600 RepID=A0A2T0VG41_9MICO|nr:protocatechuate 3,4-dioxygenase subunit alpha [Glaciihabitans tibetensis]PRY69177.1 protocatechuate 3,4-dioxygenase alpha subunit [Glaciihabitans tibetensis]